MDSRRLAFVERSALDRAHSSESEKTQYLQEITKPLCRRTLLCRLMPPGQQPYHACQQNDRHETGDTQYSKHGDGICSRCRVVAAAVKKNQISGTANHVP